ncbi:BTAD domain-containing putative transcriptional regulator [Streptomyces argenteolus]|uniref:BTAD domain-containing putative transcriptional regulator n=1 Tax=Streptomyces argenteolus TaxID=67274 RepID=A0ABW6XGG3_9ACTN
MLEHRLLGPVEMRIDGRLVDTGPPQRRLVLAVLLAEIGRPVTVEALIDRVWGENPPSQPRASLHAHVARIRSAAAGALGEPGAEVWQLRRFSGGYTLIADPGSVDLHSRRRLVEEASGPHSTPSRRVELLRAAMRQWRGWPLAGCTGDWAERSRAEWRREHTNITLAWAQAELSVGRPAEVLGTLAGMAEEDPLTEPLTINLMRALHMVGRTSEALARYAALRHTLSEELGTSPGPEAQKLHRAMLDGDTVAPPQHRGGPLSARAPRVPAQLPADVPSFVGRTHEMDCLTARAWPQDTKAGATIAISTVSGTAGVGKTALAVRWGHQHRAQFPGGQLYANLRGYDVDRPAETMLVLAGFLSALGIPATEIPDDPEARAALFRSELADRRMLIILDNASSAEQVRPLLPGTPTCTTLVTSRDPLAGLVALNGAHRLDIDLLPLREATRLLRTLVGRRVDLEPAAATRLAEQCGRLPLALRLVAELAASRPDAFLTELVEELDDHRSRLDLFEAGGDERAAVRSVFNWSYQRLTPRAARTFRLLGLHPALDFDIHSVAALTGQDLATVDQDLRALTKAHLIQPAPDSHSTMHDLLRAYARDPTDSADPRSEQHHALASLFDYFIAAARTATHTLFKAPDRVTAPPPHRSVLLPDLARSEDASRWLSAAMPSLLATCEASTRHKWAAPYSTTLALVIHTYLHSSGQFSQAVAAYSHAVAAAQETGDELSEALLRTNLGTVLRRLAQHDRATAHHEWAITAFRALGRPADEARNLFNLGIIDELQGNYAGAAERHSQAVELAREAGDGRVEADALICLGIANKMLRNFDTAARCYESALALCTATGNTLAEASAAANLALLRTETGDYETAVIHFGQSLVIFRALGSRTGEAHVRRCLGDLYTRTGQPERGLVEHHPALETYRQTADLYGQVRALIGIGDALLSLGRGGEAMGPYTDALRISSETQDREAEALAHCGLASVHHAAGETEPAGYRWQQALPYLEEFQPERAADVRARLDALKNGTVVAAAIRPGLRS